MAPGVPDMARFRSVARGVASGEAARLSDRQVQTEAGGWNGKVCVTVTIVDGRDFARVELGQVRGQGRIAVLWEGFLDSPVGQLPQPSSDI